MAKVHAIFTDGKATVNIGLSTDDHTKTRTNDELGVSGYGSFVANPTKARVASLTQNFNKLDEYMN